MEHNMEGDYNNTPNAIPRTKLARNLVYTEWSLRKFLFWTSSSQDLLVSTASCSFTLWILIQPSNFPAPGPKVVGPLWSIYEICSWSSYVCMSCSEMSREGPLPPKPWAAHTVNLKEIQTVKKIHWSNCIEIINNIEDVFFTSIVLTIMCIMAGKVMPCFVGAG